MEMKENGRMIEGMGDMKKISVDERLESNGWRNAVKDMKMPEQMKDNLLQSCGKDKSRVHGRLRLARLLPVACMVFILATTGITAHAVYMYTHLRVFVEHDVTSEELSQIEEALSGIEGICVGRFVSGDDAWKEFSDAYLTPEMTAMFEENPLAESANFEVRIPLKAEVEELKKEIEKIDGVRRVCRFSEEP